MEKHQYGSKMRKLRKFFFYINAKLNRRKNKRLTRISIEGLTFTHSKFTVTAEEYPKTTFRMEYSDIYREYYLEKWLSSGSEFIVSENSTKIILPDFPVRMSRDNGIVNYIEYNDYEFEEISCFFSPTKEIKNIDLIFSSFCKTIGKYQNLNEDSFFVSRNAIGIADGIGSLLGEFGISSKDFSRELMSLCKEQMEDNACIKSCKKIVQSSLDAMKNGGSSTFLLVSLTNNHLHISNLGDCKLEIYRRIDDCYENVFNTFPKQYSFNTPYQVSKKFSVSQLNQKASKKKNLEDTKFIDSDEYCIKAYKDDLIIIGSDGLFDNVYQKEIDKFIKSIKKKPKISEITEKLCDLAYKNSLGFSSTPFEDAMRKANNYWVGGKKDDITVIVSHLV